VEKIKSNLEFISFEAGWAGDIELYDDVDFSDFPDCGFGYEEDQTEPYDDTCDAKAPAGRSFKP
jgi:hypothetical protein